MEIIIGAVLIVGAIVYAIYMFKSKGNKIFEIRYIRRTTIKDAADIVFDLSALDPMYRHYVQLEGIVESTDNVCAPFSKRNCAYYENHCYSVSQEAHTTIDRNGARSTMTNKVEHEISSEKSSTQIYIKNSSCDKKVYVDMNSFEKDVELVPACDRFEQKNSPFIQNMSMSYNLPFGIGSISNLLGYRFKENILIPKQPLLVLGELYAMGDDLYIGKATLEKKKPSLVSYKSEDDIVSGIKKDRTRFLILCLGAIIIGLIFIYVGLNP